MSDDEFDPRFICGKANCEDYDCPCWSPITPADWKGLLAKNGIDSTRDPETGAVGSTVKRWWKR